MTSVTNSLTVEIIYTLDEDTYKINSEANDHGTRTIIEEYLRLQMGAGVDKSPPIKANVYTIVITWHPENDNFICKHNTGNLGLRDGILAHVLKNHYKDVTNKS